jgi:hypothetical protein
MSYSPMGRYLVKVASPAARLSTFGMSREELLKEAQLRFFMDKARGFARDVGGAAQKLNPLQYLKRQMPSVQTYGRVSPITPTKPHPFIIQPTPVSSAAARNFSSPAVVPTATASQLSGQTTVAAQPNIFNMGQTPAARTVPRTPSQSVIDAQAARRQHFANTMASRNQSQVPQDFARRAAPATAPTSPLNIIDDVAGGADDLGAAGPGFYQQMMGTNLGGQTIQQYLADPALFSNIRGAVGPYGLPAALLGGTYLAGKAMDTAGRVVSPAPQPYYPQPYGY